eukprot:5172943-Alexandrium_andersonii.AAC.1
MISCWLQLGPASALAISNCQCCGGACADTSANIAQQWFVTLLAASKQADGKHWAVACRAAACQLVAINIARAFDCPKA